MPNASPKLLNSNKDHLSKKVVFWSNAYKTEMIMTTSLIEVLELPNFDHMTTSKIYFESYNKFLLMTLQT